jgi:hypothetical protein
MGYVIETGLPVISWIGCPYYLLDEHDTIDKIEVRTLRPIAETVGEMIKLQMTAGQELTTPPASRSGSKA